MRLTHENSCYRRNRTSWKKRHPSAAKGHDIVLLLGNPHKFNLKNERIHIVKGDVLEISDVEKAIAGCDVVIHAAADTVQHHRSIDDYKVNTLGTKNILSACKKRIFK